jgi:ADP-ribosylglycohydrolase
MRVISLALWHQGDDAALVHAAREQSLVTHGHLRSQLCCALYCLWARQTLNEAGDPWAEAVETVRALFPLGSPERNELEFTIKPDDAPHGTGSGYVLESLHSARLALQAPTYEGVIKSAIALGNDTDTTACIAGGIAGIRDGIQAIPARWLSAMRGREIADPLLERLLVMYQ